MRVDSQKKNDDIDGRRRRYSTAIALITIAMLLVGAFWGVVSPPWFGPDELRHYNSVSRLVAGDGWPLPYQAEVRADTWQAVIEADMGPAFPRFEGEPLEDVPLPENRSPLHGPTEMFDHDRDAMVQHPPGYYAFTSLFVSLAGGGDLRWDHAQLIMRLVSAALLAAAAPFIVGTVRLISRSRRAAVIGGTSLLTIPFFGTMGGFVSNDTLLVTACSAALYFAVRALRQPDKIRVMLPLAGLSLGVALFTKGLALLLVPIVGLMVFVAARRAYGTLLHTLSATAGTLGIAFVIGGWWWLRNLLLIGKIQPSQFAVRQPGSGFDHDFRMFFEEFWIRYNRLFWGRGSREFIAFPSEIVDVAGLLLVLAVVVVLVLSRERLLYGALIAFPLLVIAVTLRNAHSIYVDHGVHDRGVQGRYVYGGIAAFAATWGLLWVLLRQWFRNVAAWMTVVVPVAAGSVTIIATKWVVNRLFSIDMPMSRWEVATAEVPIPVGTLWAFGVPFLLCMVGLIVIALIETSEERGSDEAAVIVDQDDFQTAIPRDGCSSGQAS